jgi:hypothetical protein
MPRTAGYEALQLNHEFNAKINAVGLYHTVTNTVDSDAYDVFGWAH